MTLHSIRSYGKTGASLTAAHELTGRKEREEGRGGGGRWRRRRKEERRKGGHQLSLLPCPARKKEPVRKS